MKLTRGVSTSQPKDYVAFIVQDNGEGMPREVAARALKPLLVALAARLAVDV
jgi:signal transduction histidine kinase